MDPRGRGWARVSGCWSAGCWVLACVLGFVAGRARSFVRFCFVPSSTPGFCRLTVSPPFPPRLTASSPLPPHRLSRLPAPRYALSRLESRLFFPVLPLYPFCARPLRLSVAPAICDSRCTTHDSDSQLVYLFRSPPLLSPPSLGLVFALVLDLMLSALMLRRTVLCRGTARGCAWLMLFSRITV